MEERGCLRLSGSSRGIASSSVERRRAAWRERFAGNAFRRVGPHAIAGERQDARSTGMLPVRRFDPAAITSAVAQLDVPDPRWWERLSSITAETLVISGGPASHVSLERLAAVARAIPRAELVTIPVGHRVHSRGAVRFGAAVLPFLAAR
ncbi:putative hydrolase [Minicystis rosea]|nr:putative hydrolase [Minicystis rosea]